MCSPSHTFKSDGESDYCAMWLDPVLLPPTEWNSNWHSFTDVNNGGERFLVTQCTLQFGCDGRLERRWGGLLELERGGGGVKTS